jgi:rhodanese-related sulfurtransferase
MVGVVTPEEVARRLRDPAGRVVLLDVRDPDERERARIEPSVFIPMQEIPSRLSELPSDREIIVYCHTGMRSAMVCGFLESQGYARVANLKGGIEAWSIRVDPTVPRY